MGKFDHIAELTGSDNYPSWRRAVELALAGEGLWNHCSNGIDPLDVAEFASQMPKAATAGQPTAAELGYCTGKPAGMGSRTRTRTQRYTRTRRAGANFPAGTNIMDPGYYPLGVYPRVTTKNTQKLNSTR